MNKLEFRLLGSVEARVDGQPIDLGYAKQRCVLALLLVDVGRVVPAGRLIDRIWGPAPPPSARSVLYGHVARLRRALAEAGGSAAGVHLHRRSGGYLLDADPASIDLHRFRALTARARRCGGTGDFAAQVSLLNEALDLWRGPALTGTDGPWVEQIRFGLERERIAARLAYCDARMRLGGHDDVVSELAELAADDPLNEGVISRLMLALYRTGHIGAALDSFAQARQRLVDQLGTDPGVELDELHRSILRRDAALTGLWEATPIPAAGGGSDSGGRNS
ncbi:hypothetical protein GCM10022251_44180 [Phytohabitans flavus]|uniref:OmpR/PhoB-type domain-containing protein n=1 Tax=Phytohabitans flavus TaxID=1076124 RepID=A0A6F8XYC3_9ACTN|nr:AfsR/SARP family transcriptional regulator [Phytohabitans flavus]BCB78862.1 hypothetical protein Pflav_052720 [Phytohabitans flavus]